MKLRVFLLTVLGLALLSPAVLSSGLTADAQAALEPRNQVDITGTYSNHFCTGAPRDC